jgi:spore coat polysaccharide biosynthesis predicted glycosyltransferase SpsG
MKSALVWADSGAGVGLGHVARCCAVALELIARGVNVTLMSPDDRGARYARERNVPAVGAAAGFGVAVGALQRRSLEAAILDSYRLGPDDYATARGAAPVLAVFSDGPATLPICDVVVNGAPGAETMAYPRRCGTDYLLGAQYFPLRSEFRSATPKAIAADVERVVVTVGGEDVHGRLGEYSTAARAVYPHAQVIAVAGRPVGDVRVTSSGCDLRIAPPDYPALVQRADVIVCGGGQSLIEAVAVGTPAAAILLGDDQRHQHAAVLAAGACLDGGAWNQPPIEREAAIRGALERLADVAARRQLSARGMRLIDGRGAPRIADALMTRQV